MRPQNELQAEVALTCYDVLSENFDDSILLSDSGLEMVARDEVKKSALTFSCSSLKLLVDREDDDEKFQNSSDSEYCLRAAGEFSLEDITKISARPHLSIYNDLNDLVADQELGVIWSSPDIIGTRPRWRISEKLTCLDFNAPLSRAAFAWRD
ncbi:hypothetical protein GCM10007304_11480 [Rhodococcoides trifolii]|uniref:Uncharacterized protein n=2 Tax=Rhodococcoides trifolii TaxID=908250 RepID=A0A917CV36_9NOCA|nr:hypothetical protein GCM10007304_11480 [Rhodococcus trifolii]